MTAPSDPRRTDDRILDVALATFGTRGYEATSLDALGAELGIRKQTILYWFPSKEALLAAVVERAAADLVRSLDQALAEADRRSGPEADLVAVVFDVVFQYAVRQPALLGLLREVNRLGPQVDVDLAQRVQPLVVRALGFLDREMAAGRLRRADPRMVLLFAYATVVGVATEVEAQRAVGVEPSVANLRRLRRELLAFLRAGLGVR